MTHWKPIAWFATGAAAGVLGAALWLERGADDAEGALASMVAGVADFALGRSDGAGGDDEPAFAERLEAYREAQLSTDLDDLTSALERAAMRTRSPGRDLEIDALLGRLSELAPAHAAELAVALRLEAPFVAAAYVALADADADAAIAALGRIRGGSVRKDVALALTAIVGDDTSGIARIGAVLGPFDRDALRMESLARRAARDPLGAFREATAIAEPSLREEALEWIAAVWAAKDPHGALAHADRLPEELAEDFRGAAYYEWSRLDAEGYAAYVESVTSLPVQAIGSLGYLAATNPALAERLAARFPDTLGFTIRAAALAMLAARDPASAKAQAEALPPGQLRDLALQEVAAALAAADPEAALDWARGLSPPSRSALSLIALQLAGQDVERVFALIDDPPPGVDPAPLFSAATSLLSTHPDQLPKLAALLNSRGDAQSAQALQRLIDSWMRRDPEAALGWVLAQGTEVDADVLGSAAQTMAARDHVAAAAFVDRVPPAQRGGWIVQVATRYGRNDPQGAVVWLAQYQGLDFYEPALRQVAVSAAETDPLAAAGMVSQASAGVQLGAAPQVASALARQDPRAALRWAESFGDPRVRTSAVGAAVAAWAADDLPAARRWSLDQRPGEDRDRILGLLVIRAAASGEFDRDLLAGFDSDGLRDQAAGGAIQLIARSSLAQARDLLEREIDDPAERARLAAQIAEHAQSAGPVVR